ncbi:hypothetical protein F5B19DRAFT_453470 [Rostrohypoxylon terebratum]|nr:hypothetical protein F5B19DRAFT_453470 [Rostrohypoxylon terebratum]
MAGTQFPSFGPYSQGSYSEGYDDDSSLGARTDFLHIVRHRKVQPRPQPTDSTMLTERNLAINRAIERSALWQLTCENQDMQDQSEVWSIDWVQVWMDDSGSDYPGQLPQEQDFGTWSFYPSNPPFPGEAHETESSSATLISSREPLDKEDGTPITSDYSSEGTWRFSGKERLYSSDSETNVESERSDTSVDIEVYKGALKDFPRAKMAYDMRGGIDRMSTKYPGPHLRFSMAN